jgi:hypothetical protein
MEVDALFKGETTKTVVLKEQKLFTLSTRLLQTDANKTLFQ